MFQETRFPDIALLREKKCMSDYLQSIAKPSKEDPLAIMGRYILSPAIFNILNGQKPWIGGEIQLMDAISKLNRS